MKEQLFEAVERLGLNINDYTSRQELEEAVKEADSKEEVKVTDWKENMTPEKITVLVKIAIMMEERTEEFGFDYAYQSVKKELNTNDETFKLTLIAIMEMKEYL